MGMNPFAGLPSLPVGHLLSSRPGVRRLAPEAGQRQNQRDAHHQRLQAARRRRPRLHSHAEPGLGKDQTGRPADRLRRHLGRASAGTRGMIPGAFHAARGMLECSVAPGEPLRQGYLRPGKTFVPYRGSAWRSSLAAATLQDMGLSPVCHIGGAARPGRTPVCRWWISLAATKPDRRAQGVRPAGEVARLEYGHVGASHSWHNASTQPLGAKIAL